MLHCEKKVHDKVLNPETEPTRPSVSDSLESTCSMSYSPSCSSLISSLKPSLSTVTPLPSSKLRKKHRQNLHIILLIFHLKIRLNHPNSSIRWLGGDQAQEDVSRKETVMAEAENSDIHGDIKRDNIVTIESVQEITNFLKTKVVSIDV